MTARIAPFLPLINQQQTGIPRSKQGVRIEELEERACQALRGCLGALGHLDLERAHYQAGD
jgi:hypothetical protein